MAKIEADAHGMLHKMIDEVQLGRWLQDEGADVTLDWASLADYYDPQGLAVVIGTLRQDGSISYEETSLTLIG